MSLTEISISLSAVVIAPLLVYLGKLLGKLVKGLIDNIKHEGLQHAVWVLVRGAEKLLAGKSGKKKLGYVLKRLQKKFPWASKLKLEENIEAGVVALRAEMGNAESSRTKS